MMELANETSAFYADNEYKDKEIFVNNLGWLLSQTREHVVSCNLIDNNTVEVVFNNGSSEYVNITFDSYVAIIKDVLKII